MRILACVTAFVCSLAHAAWEDQFAGLWWNPAQSGWGVSIHQQGQNVLATLLIYGKNGEAKWYQARDIVLPEWNSYILWDPVTFTAPLREGGTSREVGTISFTLEQDHGTVSYRIEGFDNRSEVVRLTFARPPIDGEYSGAATLSRYGGCAAPSRTGKMSVSISQGADTVRLNLTNGAFTCSAQGTYQDLGSTGAISGRAQCTGIDGMPGDAQFYATDVRADRDVIGMDFHIGGGASGACGVYGPLKAARVGARLADADPPHDDVGGLWIAREGWGITAHQQANNLFALVLAADGTWYAAPNASYSSGQDGDFTVYGGELLAVQGSPYTQRGGYDASQFKARLVGHIELTDDIAGYNSAFYDADGVAHPASLPTRWASPRNTSIAGSYLGVRTNQSLTPPTAGGINVWDEAGITYISIEMERCAFSGKLEWQGQTGRISGSGECMGMPDTDGPFTANDIRITDQGISMRYWFAGAYGSIAAVRF